MVGQRSFVPDAANCFLGVELVSRKLLNQAPHLPGAILVLRDTKVLQATPAGEVGRPGDREVRHGSLLL